MKKLVLAIAALGLISLTSCKKDYTCSCTTFATGSGIDGQTIETKTGKMKKKDAEKKCESSSTSTTVGGVTAGMKCVLK